jgi:hypothetical protein
MFDLLSIEEDKLAAAQGWGVFYVYDLSIAKYSVRILALSLPHPHSEAAGIFVVGRARFGDPLAQKALKLLMHGAPKK